MGWSGGTHIMERLIDAANEAGLEPGQKKILFEASFDALTDLDWDTIEEAEGLDDVLDEVIQEAGYASDLDEDEEDEDEEEGW